MIDRALRRVFRGFSTFFLIAAFITLPLHAVYAVTFQRVLMVQEIHDDIWRFPEHRQVRSVGRVELGRARAAWIATAVLEILLLPFMARASAVAVEDERRGRIPTAVGSWRGALSGRGPRIGRIAAGTASAPAHVAALGLFAVAVAAIGSALAAQVTQALPDRLAFLGVAALQGSARALAAPFLAVPLAVLAGSAKGAPDAEPTI